MGRKIALQELAPGGRTDRYTITVVLDLTGALHLREAHFRFAIH
jgi:hypothetical protein